MAWLAISIGVVLAGALGAVMYAGAAMGKLPEGNPKAVLAAGGPPTDTPVVVCLGDSLTQAGLGADWVGGLRERLAGDAFVINAGVGGQITWDLRQRLDEVAQCTPAAVVLLVGSNDAVGALGGGWASFYAKGRPQAPAEDWFAQQYDGLVAELLTITPGVVCLTLPPLGEDPAGQVEAIVQRQNQAISESATEHGADVLDLHAALTEMQAASGTPSGVPFLSGIPQFMTWAIGSVVRHRLLGQSFDAIGRRRGLTLSADTIHPTERTAEAMLAQIEPWVRQALATGEQHEAS